MVKEKNIEDTSVMSTYARLELCFIRGKGSWLYTNDGNKYLDLAAGIAVNSLGHCHPEMVKNIKDQAEKLWHTSNLYTIEPQEKLAKQLCKLSFADKIFFCNSGAESSEGLIKIARRYHYINGDKDRNRIIVARGAFHGRTLGGLAAGDNKLHREGFEPVPDGFDRVDYGNISELKAKINKQTAAIFIEPIQGEGGINVSPKNYIPTIRKICDDNGILFGLDEVQSGVGRTGKLFSYEWENVTPDLMSLAKGLGGGFPIGAILSSKEACKGMVSGTHGSTFGGNYLACIAAKTVLDHVAEPKFLENVLYKGKFIKNRLAELTNRYKGVFKQIKGRGLMIGIECIVPNTKVFQLLKDEGVLTVPAAGNVIRLMPPLNIEDQDIQLGLEKIEMAVRKLSDE